MRVLLASALGMTLLAVLALPVVPEPAAAEPVTVPYVDRLGCGVDDATVTPVFSWAGGGTATNGAAYAPTTAASAYPAPAASFSGVTGASNYTTYAPVGYGSDFQYRGTGALGFAPVTPRLGATLTVQLPHPQAVQFTVGGIQRPSRLQITGNGPEGNVVPAAAARATTPGSATAVTTGSSVQVVGGVANGASDENPRYAVDVWFPSPVSTITLTLNPAGEGADGGFLVTAPVACQAGTVTTTPAVEAGTVDAGAGRVSHDVSMVTTVRNSSPTFGATLYPSVSAPLRAAAEAQGMTVDAVIATTSSSPACAPSVGFDGSGALIDPGGQGLAPGAECTLEWTATLSMPQSTADRTVDLTSTLRSSGAEAGRLKSQTSTALVFPGRVSELAITDSGATQAQPGQSIARSATITNNGEGVAIGTAYSLAAPAEATLSGLPAECTTDGLTADCGLGNIAPGASVTINYALTVGPSTSPGTTLSVDAVASSSAQTTPAAGGYSISVVAIPVRPPIDPPSCRPHNLRCSRPCSVPAHQSQPQHPIRRQLRHRRRQRHPSRPSCRLPPRHRTVCPFRCHCLSRARRSSLEPCQLSGEHSDRWPTIRQWTSPSPAA